MEITSDIYTVCASYPKHETYGIGSQMCRAAVSIASNIAEGSNRGNTHFKHFINISLGSSFELQTQILISGKIKYLSEEQTLTIENKIIEFQKMTTSFLGTLDQS